MNKQVNGQPLKRMHLSNIVNNCDDKIANLTKDVSDLKRSCIRTCKEKQWML